MSKLQLDRGVVLMLKVADHDVWVKLEAVRELRHLMQPPVRIGDLVRTDGFAGTDPLEVRMFVCGITLAGGDRIWRDTLNRS